MFSFKIYVKKNNISLHPTLSLKLLDIDVEQFPPWSKIV